MPLRTTAMPGRRPPPAGHPLDSPNSPDRRFVYGVMMRLLLEGAMSRTACLLLAFVSVVVVVSAEPSGFPSAKNGDWPHYTADMRGTRYSPLDQITAKNFNTLEVAWR